MSLYIQEYTEKSFVLLGDTKQFKDEITEFDISNVLLSDKDNDGLNFKEYFYDKK